MNESSKKEYTITELEQLSWYDLTAQLDIKSFNWGGIGTWDEMMEICNFDVGAKILMVGSNIGTAALYMAEKYGLYVVGIDTEVNLIKIANETAQSKNLSELTEFKVIDGNNPPFDENEFDGVFTEFMAYFLDLPLAIKNYYRILKPGGILGFNELMKELIIPKKQRKKIIEAEESFKELTGYPFYLPTKEFYYEILKNTGFSHLNCKESEYSPSLKDAIKLIGGWKKMFKLIFVTYNLIFKSKILRQKFLKQARIKKIIIRNQRTAKYINPAQLTAKKPLNTL